MHESVKNLTILHSTITKSKFFNLQQIDKAAMR